jgi:hypothetical protein
MIDVGRQAVDQSVGLRAVAALAAGQDKAYGDAQAAHRQMDLGAQARHGSGQGPDRQTPFFGAGSMLMGADDGAVDDQVLEVGIVRHGLEDTLPDSLLVAPAAEAAEHAVPIAKDLRQIAPRRSLFARSTAHLRRTCGCRGRSNPSGQAVQ